MKALKDCKWEVCILHYGAGMKFGWNITIPKNTGIQSLYSNKTRRTKQGAKKNWERFAKLNGITNWKYV